MSDSEFMLIYVISNVSVITEGQIGQESYKDFDKTFPCQQTEFCF